jgi:MipA family protein
MKLALTVAAAGAFAMASIAGAARADEPQATSDWKISVGPGLYVFPKFPGSSQLQVLPFPVQDISWKDRVFSQGPDLLGVNALLGANYHLGASVSFDFQSRSASDDPRLKGLPDVHYGPKLRLFADYTWWAFTGAAAVYKDIAGTGQGLTARHLGERHVYEYIFRRECSRKRCIGAAPIFARFGIARRAFQRQRDL